MDGRTRKLELNKETLRELQETDLSKIAGGACVPTLQQSNPMTICFCQPPSTDCFTWTNTCD